MRRAAVLLVPALVGSGLVIVTRPDDAGSVPEVAAPPRPNIDLAPAGLVVSLRRAGGGGRPLPAEAPATFRVAVAAAAPVAAVELWDGDAVVATYRAPAGRTTVAPSLRWTPTELGRHLVTARAADTEGRVGLSNPVWVEVTEAVPIEVIADPVAVQLGDELARQLAADPAAQPPAGGSGAGPLPAASPTTPPPPRRDQQVEAMSVPAGIGLDLPSVDVAADGCSVEITVTATSAADLILLLMPPDGTAAVPVAELGAVDADGAVTHTTMGTGGTQAFVAAQLVDGAVAAWSPPALVAVDEKCAPPGWSGDISIVDGRLVAATDATEAYLYLESKPGTWTRVPATGTVARRPDGTFDLDGHLPDVAGSLTAHAWGWQGDSLVRIGSGTFDPPQPPAGTEQAIAPMLPPTKLRWIKPGTGKSFSSPVTAGTIDVDPDDDEIGTHLFGWSTPLGAVTHGLLQVSYQPLPEGPWGNPLIAFTCRVPGDGGPVEIDFDAGTCDPSLPPSGPTGPFAAPTYGSLIPAGVGFDADDYVSEKDPLLAAEQAIYGNLPGDAGDGGGSIGWPGQRVVRVLPMTGDSWFGAASNDVTLELDRTPKAPPGVQPYDLDLTLVTAPRPPIRQYMACWQFTGWKDDEEAKALAAQEKAAFLASVAGASNAWGAALLRPNPTDHPHFFWTSLTKLNGPICPGTCKYVDFPDVGPGVVGLGGADCSSSSSFWEDPVGYVVENFGEVVLSVVKDLVNLAAQGFAELKQLAVDGLMTITQCTGEMCEVLANAVITGALLALGVPPTIPDFDQLVAIGKGKIVEAAVALAESAGFPCEEAGTAATLHGEEDLTCEGVVEAFVDELVTAVNAELQTAATAGGITFHPDMRIKPWWSGQVGPAEVDVTVNPTKYSAEEGGETCTAGVISHSTWTAPQTSFQHSLLGFVKLPKTTWEGFPFEVSHWDLPDLPTKSAAIYGHGPATQTYQLYPPYPYDLVEIEQAFSLFGSLEVSPHTFLLHKGATFLLHVGGYCARSETNTYVLDGSIDGALVSSVDG